MLTTTAYQQYMVCCMYLLPSQNRFKFQISFSVVNVIWPAWISNNFSISILFLAQVTSLIISNLINSIYKLQLKLSPQTKKQRFITVYIGSVWKYFKKIVLFAKIKAKHKQETKTKKLNQDNLLYKFRFHVEGQRLS